MTAEQRLKDLQQAGAVAIMMAAEAIQSNPALFRESEEVRAVITEFREALERSAAPERAAMTSEELLTGRIEELGARLLRVEAQLASVYAEPEECRQHACTYYQHYLAYGPADLTHEGYHVAERRCEQAQKACEAWHAAHGDLTTLAPCCQRAKRWEKRVRA